MFSFCTASSARGSEDDETDNTNILYIYILYKSTVSFLVYPSYPSLSLTVFKRTDPFDTTTVVECIGVADGSRLDSMTPYS